MEFSRFKRCSIVPFKIWRSRKLTLLKQPLTPQYSFKLDTIIREKESFNHATEITKSYGKIEQVLNWCKSELLEEWRWQLLEVSSENKPGRYCFFFDSERDYLAFVMKWA
jgi:hypothetical protein